MAGCASDSMNVAKTLSGTPTVVKHGRNKLELVVLRNAVVFSHPSEARKNGGTCHRLRARDISRNSGEVSLIDFDRAALKQFLDRNQDKTVAGRLVLAIRAVQRGPGKLEVAALDSGVDWVEGTKDQKPAEKGEVCYAAAQLGVQPWTAANGRPVKNLGELFYNAKNDSVRTMLSSKPATVTDADKKKFVNVELDGKFVQHLATDPNCRGIIVFTRGGNTSIYFSSRDKAGKEPRLIVTVE